MGSNLVWHDELDKIEEFFCKLDPVSKKEIKYFVDRFTPELKNL